VKIELVINLKTAKTLAAPDPLSLCRATNRLDWAADPRRGHRGSSGIPHSLSRRLIR
jgi:hypothetical protein